MVLGLRSGCGDGDGKDVVVWVEKSRCIYSPPDPLQ
jgi:hypothetical protein